MTGPQFVNPKGSNLTPESVFEQRVKAGRDNIQREFQFEWDSINQLAKVNRYSPQKHQQLLIEAQIKAQGRVAEFDQEYQATINNFKNLKQLESQGIITNATEAGWRLVLGPEAERMMPKADKQINPVEQHEKLTRQYDNLLKYKAEKFRMHDKPWSWFTGDQLEIRRDPYTDTWTPDLTPEERKLAADIDNSTETTQALGEYHIIVGINNVNGIHVSRKRDRVCHVSCFIVFKSLLRK